MRMMKELLRHKREGHTWTRAEIDAFVHGVVHSTVSEAQAAAFLMAVCINGMDSHETAALTMAMATNGEEIPRRLTQRPAIDKHSTGGVGDKVSILLAPIAVACGLTVPMISGRGLGHTGGTLDKLESVRGFRTQLDMPELTSLLTSNYLFMAGQTQNLAPADRILYALRDVTGTVENITLLTASILSKKLAEGLDGLVMDMKVGNGAFMPTIEGAQQLAESIRTVCLEVELPVSFVFTRMDQPLGHSIGNWLEMVEAEATLRESVPKEGSLRDGVSGEGSLRDGASSELIEVTVALASQMLLLAGVVNDVDEAVARVNEVWNSGEAHAAFHAMIRAQGGDWQASVDYYGPFQPLTVIAEADGFVAALHAREVGLAALHAGAGRMRESDVIDHVAGIVLRKRVGDSVERGDVLAEVYAKDNVRRDVLAKQVLSLYEMTTAPHTGEPSVIIDVWPWSVS